MTFSLSAYSCGLVLGPAIGGYLAFPSHSFKGFPKGNVFYIILIYIIVFIYEPALCLAYVNICILKRFDHAKIKFDISKVSIIFTTNPKYHYSQKFIIKCYCHLKFQVLSNSLRNIWHKPDRFSLYRRTLHRRILFV